jgi:hypothetical protein
MFSTWNNLSWNIVDTDIFHYLGKRYCISMEKLSCLGRFSDVGQTHGRYLVWKIEGRKGNTPDESAYCSL